MNKQLSILMLVCLTGILIMTDSQAEEKKDSLRVNKEMIAEAEKLIGLEFTDDERQLMLEDLDENLTGYESLHAIHLDNSVAPVLKFNPIPPGFSLDCQGREIVLSAPVKTGRPENLEELAYYSVRDLGELLRTRKITSQELTKLCRDAGVKSVVTGVAT